MSENLPENQLQLIRDIATKNGFVDYNVQVEHILGKGEHFLSVVYSVRITENNTGKSLDIFLKCAQSAETLRKHIPLNSVFVREALCYEELFPAYQRLLQEKGAKCQYLTHAKLFGELNDDKFECLALEDMRSNQFKMHDKRKCMNEDHLVAVLKAYSEWHAFSLALKDQKPEEHDLLKDKFQNIFTEYYKDTMENTRQKIDELISFVDQDNIKQLLLIYKNELLTLLEDMESESLFFVHGDSWCNNILFQYEDEQNPLKPTKVCLVDWQVSRVAGTPVIDLAYFLCSSAPKEVLHNYTKYLKIYHEHLSMTLKNLGTDVTEIFPYSQLQRHWKKYCKFGIYSASFIIKVSLSDPTEAPDLQETADSGKNIFDALNYEMKNIDEYKERMRDVIYFMADNDFI